MQHIRMLFRGEVRKCLLHFAVVVGNTIVAASFAGPTRAVNGILHDFKKAPLDIITGNGIARRFDALDGEYQSYSNSLEKGILHGIILHEGFFRGERRFVLLPTGDVNDLNRFFVENYSLLEEWQDKYVSLFSSRIRSLYIYKNEDIPLWQSMRAYEINLTEKEVISTIGQMLQNKELVLPPADGTMPGSFEPGWDMRKYIKENVEGIAAEIRKMQPYHDNTNPNRKLYKAIATMGRVPLPAQADVVQALYNRLQKANYAFANGQMGTGKSIIADALVNVWHTEKKQKYTPVLLTAPATVLPKWIADEIGQDLPQARILEIKKTEDALQYIREDHGKKTGIEFVLISQDRIKLGPERWACAAVWKRITGLKKYAWHCPDCFSVLLNPDKKDDDGNLVPADWNVMAKSEPGEPIVWHQDSKVVKCPHCGAKLWQPDPHCKPRWYVARIFQKKLRRHFELYIADEIHKQKADSQRGEAFGKLVRAAKKTLGLTGTLTNGMSTAVKELFWRLAPHELLAKGFDYNTGTIAWANNYGAVESKSSRQEREGDRKSVV